uniref:diphosphoinositol-polyphosphate diphosphatase n=1 Tax=Monodelphis domestica TaxID=13616 RepID=F7FZ80_MONDO
MMKFKPNQTRTYDREGFKKRAACLCFRSEQEDEVLLVSSSRYPDQWIVPGGGMEPEEEPGGAAVREVYEEAGVRGKLGRLLGIFEQNQDRKHRTYVYVLTVTEILEDWEDSVNIGRKREWFKVEDAIKVLQCHKPVHAEYLEKLKLGCSPTNGNSMVPTLPDNNSLGHCTDSVKLESLISEIQHHLTDWPNHSQWKVMEMLISQITTCFSAN